MNANIPPVMTTTIGHLVPVSDELLVNKDGSTSLQRTTDLAAQLAGEGVIAGQFQAIRAEVSSEVAGVYSKVDLTLDAFSNRIDAAAEGYVVAATWAVLATVNGTRNKQPGRVSANDKGTHTDPISNETVANAGEYSWNASPAGWLRVGDLLDEQISDLLRESRTSLFPAVTDTPALSDWLSVLLGDTHGNVEAGFDVHGSLWAQIATAPGVPALADNLHYAWVTEDGYLLFGFDAAGDFVTLGATPNDLQLFERVVSGSSRVLALRSSGRQISFTFGERNAFSPNTVGSFVTYVEEVEGAFVSRREECVGKTSLLPSITKIVMVPTYGQSLEQGSLSSPVVSLATPRAGRAVMFEGGTRPRRDAAGDASLPLENLYRLVDIRELTSRESPATQLANFLTDTAKGFPVEAGGLVASFGVSGFSYERLKKGELPYQNLLAGVRRARIIADINSCDLQLPCVVYDQGQANITDTQPAYLAKLVQLQQDLAADLARYLVAATDVPILLEQLSNWTAPSYNLSKSGVPLAQLQAALDFPNKFKLVGPQYQYETVSDGVHLTGQSSARKGAYEGRAARALANGGNWLPLHISSAVRTGANIVLTYAGGDTSTDIAIDSTLVWNPGNNGFEWAQTGGTNRTISSVTKTGNRQITIALNGDPGAVTSSSIGYAITGTAGANSGPTTGARGNIRDGSTDLTAFGEPMHNWACHQIINL